MRHRADLSGYESISITSLDPIRNSVLDCVKCKHSILHPIQGPVPAQNWVSAQFGHHVATVHPTSNCQARGNSQAAALAAVMTAARPQATSGMCCMNTVRGRAGHLALSCLWRPVAARTQEADRRRVGAPGHPGNPLGDPCPALGRYGRCRRGVSEHAEGQTEGDRRPGRTNSNTADRWWKHMHVGVVRGRSRSRVPRRGGVIGVGPAHVIALQVA